MCEDFDRVGHCCFFINVSLLLYLSGFVEMCEDMEDVGHCCFYRPPDVTEPRELAKYFSDDGCCCAT